MTPGTLTEESLLNDRQDNLLVAVNRLGDDWGLAALDLAGARFSVQQFRGTEALLGELQRLNPAELIANESLELLPAVEARAGLRRQPPWLFETDSARRQLNEQFGTHDLRGFGCDHLDAAIGAAGGAIAWIDVRRFDLAVIDEACQSVEPGCWIPLLWCDRVVLAGLQTIASLQFDHIGQGVQHPGQHVRLILGLDEFFPEILDRPLQDGRVLVVADGVSPSQQAAMAAAAPINTSPTPTLHPP